MSAYTMTRGERAAVLKRLDDALHSGELTLDQYRLRTDAAWKAPVTEPPEPAQSGAFVATVRKICADVLAKLAPTITERFEALERDVSSLRALDADALMRRITDMQAVLDRESAQREQLQHRAERHAEHLRRLETRLQALERER
jgi:hypothetical protein